MRVLVVLLLVFVAGCNVKRPGGEFHNRVTGQPKDPYLETLASLPGPSKPINVAVYSFTDETGQRRPSEVYADLSNAVSQGGNDILIATLLRAGGGDWFNVAERDELQAVVQERTLRKQFRRSSRHKKLISADYLMTGGIIGFDSNFSTGGAGARYLGIGGNVQYRTDLITIALRLVDVSSGRVLAAVEAHDTVMSYGVQGGGVRSFSGRVFEADAGFTRNEVLTIVTRRAIAKALLQLIEEATERDIWPMGSSQKEALEHTMISLRALDYSGSELK